MVLVWNMISQKSNLHRKFLLIWCSKCVPESREDKEEGDRRGISLYPAGNVSVLFLSVTHITWSGWQPKLFLKRPLSNKKKLSMWKKEKLKWKFTVFSTVDTLGLSCLYLMNKENRFYFVLSIVSINWSDNLLILPKFSLLKVSGATNIITCIANQQLG